MINPTYTPENVIEFFRSISWRETRGEFGIQVGDRIYLATGRVDISTDPLPEGAYFVGRELYPGPWKKAPIVQFSQYCEKPHRSTEEEDRCDEKLIPWTHPEDPTRSGPTQKRTKKMASMAVMIDPENGFAVGSPAWIDNKYRDRHASVRQSLRRFAYDHLSGSAYLISGQNAQHAFAMADQISDCTELTLGLHALWAAKNYFVMGDVVLKDEFADGDLE
jgi:hypothetical protein